MLCTVTIFAPKLNNKKVLNTNECLKASEGLSRFNFKSKEKNLVTCTEKEIIENVIIETSKVLSSSQSPFFGGLGLDILGSGL